MDGFAEEEEEEEELRKEEERRRRKRSAPYGDDNQMLMGSDGPGRKKKLFVSLICQINCLSQFASRVIKSNLVEGLPKMENELNVNWRGI